MIQDFKKIKTLVEKIMLSVSRIGAFVRNPMTGIRTWVGSFDANSLYPSIIRTLNVGFENIVLFEELPEDFKEFLISIKEKLNVSGYYGNNNIKIEEYVKRYEKFSGNEIDRSKLNIFDIDKYAIYEEGNKKKKETKDIKRVSLYKEVLRATIDLIIEKDIVKELLPFLQKYNLSFAPNFVFFRKEKMSKLNKAMTKKYTLRKIYQAKEKDVIEQIKIKQEIINKNEAGIDIDSIENEIFQLDIQLSTFNQYSTMYKLLMNSGYGAISHPNCRYFDVNCTNAITSTSQYLMKKCALDIDNLIWNVTKDKTKSHCVYGDTDSLYIDFTYVAEIFNKNVRKMVDYLLKEFQPQVEDSFTKTVEGMNAFDSSILKMKLEKLGDSSFFQKRKKYVVRYVYKDGVFYTKPKLSFTGLSIQNINTPDIVEQWCYSLVNAYLDNNQTQFIKLISDYRKQFESLPIEDVSIIRNLNLYEKYVEHNSDMDKIFIGSNYNLKKQCPPVVRASAYHNYLIEKGLISKTYQLQDGDKVRIIHLKKSKFKESLIAFGEDEPVLIKKSDIDYDLMFEKVVLSNIEPFQEILKWSLHENIDDVYDFLFN